MCYERVHTDIRYIIPYIVTVFRVFILIFEKELEVLVETVLRTGPHCQTIQGDSFQASSPRTFPAFLAQVG